MQAIINHAQVTWKVRVQWLCFATDSRLPFDREISWLSVRFGSCCGFVWGEVQRCLRGPGCRDG
jgi:hypothetical protein